MESREKLIGAEADVARVMNEMRTDNHTAIGLHELVQPMYFDALRSPNPSCAAMRTVHEMTYYELCVLAQSRFVKC